MRSPHKYEGHSHIAPFDKKEWHSYFALNLGSGTLLSLFSKKIFSMSNYQRTCKVVFFSNSSDNSRLIYFWTEHYLFTLETIGGGIYLVFPLIVIVLLQCLSCSFGQNQKVNIADMHYDYDNDKNKIQNWSLCLGQTVLQSHYYLPF